jgi:hypothetical protein
VVSLDISQARDLNFSFLDKKFHHIKFVKTTSRRVFTGIAEPKFENRLGDEPTTIQRIQQGVVIANDKRLPVLLDAFDCCRLCQSGKLASCGSV